MASLSTDLLKFCDNLFGNLAAAIGLFSPDLAERVSWAFAIISICIIAVSTVRLIRRFIARKGGEAVEKEVGS